MTATASAMPSLDTAVRDSEPFIRPVATAVGILQSSVVPSLGLRSGLSVIAYGLARTTNRLDFKDYLWPTGMVVNAWWTAVLRFVVLHPHKPLLTALDDLSFSQQTLLGAVTAWGGRLAFRVIRRGIVRGEDDERYHGVKQEHNFWNKAALLFGLEAVFQTLISLPFTMPFRTDSISGFASGSAEWAPVARWTAAGLFSAGLVMETIADWQLASHKKRETIKKEQGESGELYRKGVFSIVRHPNYLADALCHIAFPLWTYGCGMFHVSQLLGPAANYFFLRWIGGDRENEAHQAEKYALKDKDKHAQLELYKLQKNSFWPGIYELANPWLWTMTAIGAAGAAAEYLFESRILEAGIGANPISPMIGESIAGLS